MNPLQFQTAQVDFRPKYNEVAKPEVSTGNSSFADKLRELQASENNHDESREKVNSTAHKNPSTEEKTERNLENKVSESKSETVARKRDSEDAKEHSVEKKSDDLIREQAPYVNLQNIIAAADAKKLVNTPVENGENEISFDLESFVSKLSKNSSIDGIASTEIQVSSDDEIEVSDEMINWLLSSGKNAKNESKIDDFSSLIEGAEEFIPGNESDKDKLLSAQTLASKDPEQFLNNIYNTAEQIQPEVTGAAINLADKFSFDDYESNNKIDSLNKAEKKGAKISVHDLRTEKMAETSLAADKVVQKTAEKKDLNLSYKQTSENSMQVTMELAGKANIESNITASSTQSAAAADSPFQQMLSNAVQQNAPDFVKAGNIVLKDNKQGSINLILHPESLGNVKIALNLNDKVISGQITVATREAYEAFKESLDSLKQAFAQSGFDTGSFDLNFSNSSGQQFAQSNPGNEQHSSFMAERSYGEFVSPKDIAAEKAAHAYESSENYSVNIVA